MGHNKLKKFSEVSGFPNVIEPPKNLTSHPLPLIALKGNWNKLYFKNENPITLELGCGKGEYTLALAKRYPDRNFIGMDIKGNRLWRGAKTALEEKLTNVAFVRSRIDFIENYFSKDEISEIWIPFPDPYLRKPRKRLISYPFIQRYRKIAPPGTIVHLKTDNYPLYSYAMEQVKQFNYPLIARSEDIYNDKNLGPERIDLLTSIQTYYEKLYLKSELKIRYVEFSI